MNVGVDVAQTCVQKAGCASVAESLARALPFARPEFTWTLLHHFGGWLNPDTRNGLRLDRAPNVSAPLLDLSLEQAAEVWQCIEAGGRPFTPFPDIWLSFSFQAPRLPSGKLVFVVHDVSFWTHPEFTTELNRFTCQKGTLDALQRADGLVFPSAASKRRFDSVLPGWLTERRLPYREIPHASRFEGVTRPARQDSGREGFWLAVGSLEPRKNHALILSAYRDYACRVASPRDLVIAGGAGWMSESIQRQLREWRPPGRVRWLGFVTDSELSGLYETAHCLIQPSIEEGFGLPVVEAASFGLSGFISDAEALHEVAPETWPRIPADRPDLWALEMVRHDSSPPPHPTSWHPLSWRGIADQYSDFLEEVHALPPKPRHR